MSARAAEITAKAAAEIRLGQAALAAGDKEKAAAHAHVALALVEVAKGYERCDCCGRRK